MSRFPPMRKYLFSFLLLLLFLMGFTGHLLETGTAHTNAAEAVCVIHSGCLAAHIETVEVNSSIKTPQIEKAPFYAYSLRVVIPHPPRPI